MLNDFKAFVMRGNVLDLATAVIIGAAFGKIVSSLVSDILMPPIGLLIGSIDFSQLILVLKDAAPGQDPVSLKIGLFLGNVVDFLIIASVIFLLIRAVASIKRKEAPAPLPTNNKNCPFCCNAIPRAASRCGFCTSLLDKEG
jgi:large conductance mechanosensitive channel